MQACILRIPGPTIVSRKMFSHFRLAILCTVLHTTTGQCKWTVPDVTEKVKCTRIFPLQTFILFPVMPVHLLAVK